MQTTEKTTNIRIDHSTHQEMRVASAHRKQSMVELINRSWEAFKATQGRNLHKPQAKA